MGGDAVGENYYILMPYLYVSSNQNQKPVSDEDQDVKLGLAAFVISTFFKPSIFYLGLVTYDALCVGWRYPLILRLAPGLSNLAVSLEGGLREKLKEKYIAPGIDVGIRFPRLNANLLARYYAESENSGLKVSASIKRYISNSHLALFADYDYRKEIRLRTSDIGVDNLLTLEYSFPLFKIRRGLWNPNIYFEDLCLLFFGESSFGEEEVSFGGGVELRQEVSLGLGNVKFPIHLGFGINKDGERVVYGGLGMSKGVSFTPLGERVGAAAFWRRH
jgi:hypothetical protein